MNQREIKRIFDYDALTGCLYWKDVKFKSSHNAIKFDGVGNRIVQYNGKMYTAARLIWTLHYGTELTRKDYLGYVDGNRNNTKIENLFLKDGITMKSVYRDIKPRVSAEKIVYDFAMNHKGATISKTFRTLTEALEYRSIVRNHLGATFIGMDA